MTTRGAALAAMLDAVRSLAKTHTFAGACDCSLCSRLREYDSCVQAQTERTFVLEPRARSWPRKTEE